MDNFIYDRKKLLDNILIASDWSRPEDKSQYTTIKVNIEFIKEYLNLSRLTFELHNNKDSFSGSLTGRQIHCIDAFNGSILEKNFQGAYHELFDFIESCKMINNKPLDTIERIFIRSALLQIERTLEER